MRVLVIGSGGREHALAWAIAKSPRLERLIVAPGNGGTARIAENAAIDITDHNAVLALAKAERIDLVVIGPDAPAVAGLGDDIRAAGLLCFGPSKAAAQLEGSKSFTKQVCVEAGIPTAAYGSFDDAASALAYLRRQTMPIVVKADGLAAGKGVTVCASLAEAEDAVRDCFSGAFGLSGSRVVIEEFLEGEEASLFALCDGETIVMLPSAQDHKRVWDGDRGPNTGGMGAYSPAPVMTAEMTERTRREIIEPTVRRMKERGTPFTGVLFAGLMITTEGPKLIEHNVRFGDPECQVLMMRLESDLLPILHAAATSRLDTVSASWRDAPALTVAMASKGYPGAYEKNTTIRALPAADAARKVFHAGTALKDGQLVATGGRAINLTACVATVAEGRKAAYRAHDQAEWDNCVCLHHLSR